MRPRYGREYEEDEVPLCQKCRMELVGEEEMESLDSGADLCGS